MRLSMPLSVLKLEFNVVTLDTSNPVPVKDPTRGEQPKKKTPYETVENSQIRLNQTKYMKSQ